jgi:hypothetical protein
MPSLLEEPIPPLFQDLETNPYDDPTNPPSDPDTIVGFCGIQWTNNTDPGMKIIQKCLSKIRKKLDWLSTV